MAIKAQLQGDKEMLRKFAQAAGDDKGVRKQGREALKEVGQEKVDSVLKPKIPVKTGALQGSARMRPMISPKKEELRITLIVGGAEAPYAHKVNAGHKSQAHFMEQTVQEVAATLAAELGAKLHLGEAFQ